MWDTPYIAIRGELWDVYINYFRENMGSHPGGHYWDYHPGALSLSQVTATHLEDRAPVDEIYGCPIFKWVAETWLHHQVPG